MSELKAFITREGFEVYLKSEADKHIQELEEKHFNDLQDAEDSFKSVLELNRKELRHHKYKRCLDKAERCEWERRFWTNSVLSGEGNLQWAKWAEKWRKRWLELAERFKEAK